MKHHQIVLLALGISGLVGLGTPVWADGNPADYIKQRTYIGAIGTSSTINAGSNEVLGFNGNYEVVTASGPFEVDLLPTVSRNFGYGGLVGHREGSYAVEVSYWKSFHDSTWSGGGPVFFNSTAIYQAFNVDLKRYLFPQLPTQPYFSLGLSFPWLIFKQGSADQFGRTGDVSYGGLGLNLGIGLEIYIGQDFSVMGGAIQRFSGFNSVSGIYQQHDQGIEWNGSTDLNIEGDGLNFMVGATFGFAD